MRVRFLVMTTISTCELLVLWIALLLLDAKHSLFHMTLQALCLICFPYSPPPSGPCCQLFPLLNVLLLQLISSHFSASDFEPKVEGSMPLFVF